MCLCLWISHPCRCWDRCGGCRLREEVSQSPRSPSHPVDTWSHQRQSDVFPLRRGKGAPEAVCRRPSSSETCGAGKYLPFLGNKKKKKKTQLQSIRGRKTKTFLYICQLNISYFLRIRITLFVSILGHWQEWPAVLEQLARAQQATRASVWPSACSSSVIQSKLSPCFNFMWKVPTLIALLIRAC